MRLPDISLFLIVKSETISGKVNAKSGYFYQNLSLYFVYHFTCFAFHEETIFVLKGLRGQRHVLKHVKVRLPVCYYASLKSMKVKNETFSLALTKIY